MNWRVKAALQTLFSVLPRGEAMNYLLQRCVTHSLPVPASYVVDRAKLVSSYAETYRRLAARPIDDATFYEFGAGTDLIGPLVLFAAGVNRQIAIDLTPLARPFLVAEAVRVLRDHPPPGARRSVPALMAAEGLTRALAQQYGIDYLAPADARATGLAPGSIDCIVSTNTLEHIPPTEIAEILTESRRLVRAGGLLISSIDYQDHYSYFDPSISVYNYLRYSARRWQLYSPALQYQNRLRHSDYLKLLDAAGWAVIENHPKPIERADREELRRLPLDAEFSRYDPDDLAVRGALIIAQPRNGVGADPSQVRRPAAHTTSKMR